MPLLCHEYNQKNANIPAIFARNTSLELTFYKRLRFKRLKIIKTEAGKTAVRMIFSGPLSWEFPLTVAYNPTENTFYRHSANSRRQKNMTPYLSDSFKDFVRQKTQSIF